MKTQSILANFQALPTDSYLDDNPDDILRAMVEDLFQLTFREEEDAITALLPGITFQVRQVYNIHQGEETFCQLHLLCADGEPVCFYGRHGHEDSADPEVHYINKEKGFSLVSQLVTALSNRRLQAFRESMAEAPENLFDMGGSEQLSSLSDTTFGQSEGNDHADQHSMLVAPFSTWIHTGEKLVQVVSFERKDTDEGRKHFACTAHGDVLLQSGKVVYQFGDSEQDRQATLKLMTAPGDWMLSAKESRAEGVPFAVVYIRRANEWVHRMRVITFRSKDLYETFVQRHADATDKLIAGEFPYETLPKNASVV